MEFLPDGGHAVACEIRRDHAETTAPESHTGLQGEGGAAAIKGDRTLTQLAGAVRRPPQSDHRMEGSA